MSILSKTWLQEWSNLPNLEFTINCWEGNINTANTAMERYRKGKIPIQKFELLETFANSHEDFPLIDKWLDIALQNGVKHLFLNFKSYPMPILRILAAKSLRELDVQGSMPDSLSSGVVNCKSLRKLSLSHLRLDENMVQTILNSCPFIVSLILEYCTGKLQKIKSDSLKVLKIHHRGIEEIDAPNLVSLDYMGSQIPELNKIARDSKIRLGCINNLNAAWFSSPANSSANSGEGKSIFQLLRRTHQQTPAKVRAFFSFSGELIYLLRRPAQKRDGSATVCRRRSTRSGRKLPIDHRNPPSSLTRFYLSFSLPFSLNLVAAGLCLADSLSRNSIPSF
uniref:F-box protein n=1 Tax=Solanum tuberosum TaxID=4113 RepID=M0ZWY3_SOLTU